MFTLSVLSLTALKYPFTPDVSCSMWGIFGLDLHVTIVVRFHTLNRIDEQAKWYFSISSRFSNIIYA